MRRSTGTCRVASSSDATARRAAAFCAAGSRAAAGGLEEQRPTDAEGAAHPRVDRERRLGRFEAACDVLLDLFRPLRVPRGLIETKLGDGQVGLRVLVRERARPDRTTPSLARRMAADPGFFSIAKRAAMASRRPSRR